MKNILIVLSLLVLGACQVAPEANSELITSEVASALSISIRNGEERNENFSGNASDWTKFNMPSGNKFQPFYQFLTTSGEWRSANYTTREGINYWLNLKFTRGNKLVEYTVETNGVAIQYGKTTVQMKLSRRDDGTDVFVIKLDVEFLKETFLEFSSLDDPLLGTTLNFEQKNSKFLGFLSGGVDKNDGDGIWEVVAGKNGIPPKPPWPYEVNINKNGLDWRTFQSRFVNTQVAYMLVTTNNGWKYFHYLTDGADKYGINLKFDPNHKQIQYTYVKNERELIQYGLSTITVGEGHNSLSAFIEVDAAPHPDTKLKPEGFTFFISNSTVYGHARNSFGGQRVTNLIYAGRRGPEYPGQQADGGPNHERNNLQGAKWGDKISYLDQWMEWPWKSDIIGKHWFKYGTYNGEDYYIAYNFDNNQKSYVSYEIFKMSNGKKYVLQYGKSTGRLDLITRYPNPWQWWVKERYAFYGFDVAFDAVTKLNGKQYLFVRTGNASMEARFDNKPSLTSVLYHGNAPSNANDIYLIERVVNHVVSDWRNDVDRVNSHMKNYFPWKPAITGKHRVKYKTQGSTEYGIEYEFDGSTPSVKYTVYKKTSGEITTLQYGDTSAHLDFITRGNNRYFLIDIEVPFSKVKEFTPNRYIMINLDKSNNRYRAMTSHTKNIGYFLDQGPLYNADGSIASPGKDNYGPDDWRGFHFPTSGQIANTWKNLVAHGKWRAFQYAAKNGKQYWLNYKFNHDTKFVEYEISYGGKILYEGQTTVGLATFKRNGIDNAVIVFHNEMPNNVELPKQFTIFAKPEPNVVARIAVATSLNQTSLTYICNILDGYRHII